MHRPGSLWPTASTIETPPVLEPITADEAKDQSRVDSNAEDSLIGDYIVAARNHVEQSYKWALVTQTWDAFYDGFPPTSGELVIPRPPLQSVTEIEYTDEDGATATVPATDYNVDTDSFPGRIRLKRGKEWPSDVLDTVNPVRVRFVAGYGDAAADVPASIRHYLLLLVATMYEHREPVVTGTTVLEMPWQTRALLDAHHPPAVA